MKRTKLSLLFLSAMLLTGCRTTDPKDPNIASVYESYKSNGGTLDYNTWLDSIKGKDGTNGKDGVNGKDGKDGTSILTGKVLLSIQTEKMEMSLSILPLLIFIQRKMANG